ncbi:MAG: M20/M25/M40 family metallo-hydrolase [Acidimicrobiales bacterium]
MTSIDPDVLRAAIEEERDAGIALLMDLVRAQSTVGQEQGALRVLESTLEELGFSIRRIPIPSDIGADPLAGIPQGPYEGRFEVLGEMPRTGGATLLLNGHIDVVPADDKSWERDPFSPWTHDGWLYGRGAGDMKAGLVMAIMALRALRHLAPECIDHDISFLGVIEEECTGNGTLAALRAGVQADVVVLPEPTDLSVLLGGVSITWLEVEITFGGGHAESSGRLEQPSVVLTRLIDSFRALEDELNEHPAPPFDQLERPYNLNIGEVRLGDWPSSVPSRLKLGLRVAHDGTVNHDETQRLVEARVNTVISELRSVRSCIVRQSGFRTEAHHIDNDHPLVRAITQAHTELHGSAPHASVIGSTTDARFYLNQAGIPAVCFGPIVRNMHGTNECVELDSITKGAQTLANFIWKYQTAGGLGGYTEGRW